MLRSFRILAFCIAATLSYASVMAQYSVHVAGDLDECTPTTTVTLQTVPGTLPEQTITLPVDGSCSYEHTFDMSTSSGGFFATWVCGTDTSVTMAGYSLQAPTDSGFVYMPYMECGQTCVPPSIIGIYGPSTACSSDDNLFFNVDAEGSASLFYYWSGPGIGDTDILDTSFTTTAVAGIYQVTVMNACGTADASVTLTVSPAPDAGIDSALSICDIIDPTDMTSLLGGTPDAGGTWTYDGQLHNGIFYPTMDTTGTYQYTVTGMAPCGTDVSYLFFTPIPIWYEDTDGDGLGDPSSSIQACDQPTGYVIDNSDQCLTMFGTIGSACDDGLASTIDDHLNADCECIGTDTAFVDCLGIPNGTAWPGTPCDDGDPDTFGDVYLSDCTCSGMIPLPCTASFWAIQAYDSTDGGGVEPILNEVWVWNLSSGGNGTYEFEWDFGDGASSNEAFPTHHYDGPGPWLLCLTMYADGCTDTYCDSVSVDENGILNGMMLDGHSTGVSTSGDRDGGFTLNVIQQIPTGIAETPAATEMNLWPNPVDRELNITYNTTAPGVKAITVIDLSGRLVIDEDHTFTTGSNTLQLSTGTLEPGLYMLRIGDGTQSISQRFLKVR